MYRACLMLRCLCFLRLLPEHADVPTRAFERCPCANDILTECGAGCRRQNLEQLLKDCFESELQRVVQEATCDFGLFRISKTEGQSGSELHEISAESSQRTVPCYSEHILTSLISSNQIPVPSHRAQVNMQVVSGGIQQKMLELVMCGKCHYLIW